ncbi:MAG: hypothetical protein PWQ78_922 [Petrotoga sp.]|nr:hypothetical protein [Petrotoga sp.]
MPIASAKAMQKGSLYHNPLTTSTKKLLTPSSVKGISSILSSSVSQIPFSANSLSKTPANFT